MGKSIRYKRVNLETDTVDMCILYSELTILHWRSFANCFVSVVNGSQAFSSAINDYNMRLTASKKY